MGGGLQVFVCIINQIALKIQLGYSQTLESYIYIPPITLFCKPYYVVVKYWIGLVTRLNQEYNVDATLQMMSYT